jgi:hypothetical protein
MQDDIISLSRTEFERLTKPQQDAVRAALRAARVQPGQHTVMAADDSGKAYACRDRLERLQWGFNEAPHFICVARGIEETTEGQR